MTLASEDAGAAPRLGHAPFRVVEAAVARVGVVVDSPHSGMEWPPDFAPDASRESILTTWDAFVDELWAGAPEAGAVLLSARFPRAYVDVNRAADDIDAELLDAPWPGPLRATDYTRRGMGLIRRLALPGQPMYRQRLSPIAVQARLDHYYHPYRDALRALIDARHAAFGTVVHLNGHSMKSRGNAMNLDHGATRPDVVVSDRQGSTADPALTAWAAGWFGDHGLSATVNSPYQGGDLVAHFGEPARGRHSLQIELNRALYMNEATFEPTAGLVPVQATLTAFVEALAAYVRAVGRGHSAS